MNLKIHHKALTELYSDSDKSLYILYTQIKSASNNVIKTRHGHLKANHILELAKYVGVSKSTLYKYLNKLSKAGFIAKSKNGYLLTSYKSVLSNQLNFNQSIKKRKDGKKMYYHPFAKLDVPSSIKQNEIESLMIYQLLAQIKRRKNFKQTGLYVPKKVNKNVPDRITIALSYLCKAGKYQNFNSKNDLYERKTKMNQLITGLEKMNLLKVKRGSYSKDKNGTYETNKYIIYPFDKIKFNSIIEEDVTETVTNKRRRVKKLPVQLKEVEKRFIDFVWSTKSVLVANGVLSYSFLNKRINKRMISNLLKVMLSTQATKEFLLLKFNESNFNVFNIEKSYFDSGSFVYDRNKTYNSQVIDLVENGGNYNPAMIIRTDRESLLKSKLLTNRTKINSNSLTESITNLDNFRKSIEGTI